MKVQAHQSTPILIRISQMRTLSEAQTHPRLTREHHTKASKKKDGISKNILERRNKPTLCPTTATHTIMMLELRTQHKTKQKMQLILFYFSGHFRPCKQSVNALDTERFIAFLENPNSSTALATHAYYSRCLHGEP